MFKLNAAFYDNREVVITSTESAGGSTLSFGSRSCTVSQRWRNKLIDLPIFHGQRSNNTQIQMKSMCYWVLLKLFTQIGEQQ